MRTFTGIDFLLHGKMHEMLSKVAVLRVLRKIPPEDDNFRTVTEFNRISFAYEMLPIRNEYFILDCVELTHVSKKVIVVPYYYDLLRRYLL